jgi:ribonuclease P protein component
MLKRENRLTDDQDFKRVMGRGQRVAGKHLIWFFLSVANQKKVGLVVSNKVSGRATDRNQLKRWLRGILVDKFSQLPTGQSVVLVRKFSKDRVGLRSELTELLERLTGKPEGPKREQGGGR